MPRFSIRGCSFCGVDLSRMEHRVCEYHSRIWDEFVEQGYVTVTVEKDGTAHMVRKL